MTTQKGTLCFVAFLRQFLWHGFFFASRKTSQQENFHYQYLSEKFYIEPFLLVYFLCIVLPFVFKNHFWEKRPYWYVMHTQREQLVELKCLWDAAFKFSVHHFISTRISLFSLNSPIRRKCIRSCRWLRGLGGLGGGGSEPIFLFHVCMYTHVSMDRF